MNVRASQAVTTTLIALILLLCAGAVLAITPARAAPPPVPIPREMLAFYYGWYGTPAGSGHWRHWQQVDAGRRDIGVATDYPRDGAYDSHDREVIGRQLKQMRDAGITGLIVSWWGQRSFEDESLDAVAAEAQNSGLKLSAYYETLPNGGTGLDQGGRVDAAAADIAYLLNRHGRDPDWLRVAGRPVVFIYARAVHQLGVDGWRHVAERLRHGADAPLLIGDVGGGASAFEMRAAFDGIHSYNDSSATAGMDADGVARWAARAFAAQLRPWPDKITCLTVYPGFDNRKAAKNPDPSGVTPRNKGRTLAALGEAALAARPDWVLLTSWNEWHEGTEIEPSDQYGAHALDEVRRLSHRFLAIPPRALALAPVDGTGGGTPGAISR